MNNFTNKEIRKKKVFSYFTKILLYTTMLLETLRILIIVQVTEIARERQVFHTTMHSVKQKCKVILSSTTKPPRFIMDDFEKEQDAFSRETDAVVPRNAGQIYNFKANRQNEAKGHVLCLIERLLEQLRYAKNIRSPVDPHQPFLCEFCLQSRGQPKFVLLLDQILKNVERFCCNNNRNTMLAFDTTLNIGEYYFTQSTYQNLHLLHQNSNKHPWFPGPVFVHGNQGKEISSTSGNLFYGKTHLFKTLNLSGQTNVKNCITE